MKKISPRIVPAIASLFILMLCSSYNIHAEDQLSAAVKASGNGNTEEIITNCGNIITGDADAGTMAKAYTLLAIGYTLQNGKDAKDRCGGLIDLIPDEISETSALPILRLLAGEIKNSDLEKAVSKAPQDWQAVATVAMYLNGVRDKAKVKELYTYCKVYQNAIIGLPKNGWAVAWNPRLVKWQSWLQSARGEKEKLEKLIADNGPKVKTKITEEDQNKRIDAVSNIIKLYLQNDIANAKVAALKEKTTYSGTYAPLYILLDYLSGNETVTPEKIFETTQANASIWALATVAMFAKSLSDSDKPNKQQLYYYIDNYDGNYKFLKNLPEIAVWKKSIDRWRKWCDAGFNAENIPDLQPLLISKSKQEEKIVAQTDVNDITTMELEAFETGRGEVYKGREHPASMVFDDDIFEKHLNTLSEKLRSTEKLRYTTVKKIKPHLVRVLERSPYPKGLLTKKRKRKGVVYMANEHILRLKKSTRSKKGKNYKWEDLAFEQYPAFMKYYAKRRLGMTGAGQNSRKKMKKDAAAEYLGIAVLYDWFGHYENALKYAQLAVETCPEMNKQVSKMMLE